MFRYFCLFDLFQQTSLGSVCKHKYFEAKADFLKVMKWFCPFFLSVCLGFYIFWLTCVPGPIAKNETEIDHLQNECEKLSTEIENLRQEFRKEKELRLKNSVELEQLQQKCVNLKKELESLSKVNEKISTKYVTKNENK